jgi:hypothetical protein
LFARVLFIDGCLLVGGSARRVCGAGRWSAIDFSKCTILLNTNPFVLLWLPLVGDMEQVNATHGNILSEVNTWVGVVRLDSQRGLSGKHIRLTILTGLLEQYL